MIIEKNTLAAYINDVQKGTVFFFPNIEAAAEATGTSPRAIKNSIKKRTHCRNGMSWDYAWNLIGDAKGMVDLGICTKEWFDEVFHGIENIDDIEIL